MAEDAIIHINEEHKKGTEAFRTLRTNLLYSSKVRVITITSTSPDEGKTVMAYHLAISFALLGKKVLLIDADMKRTSLSSLLGISRRYQGLSEYLTDQDELNIHHTDMEGFDVLSAGAIPPNSTEILTSAPLKDIIGELRKVYDYIVIDTPPYNAANDSLIVTKATDGAIITVRNEYTKKRELQNLKDNFNRSGAKVIGTILNRVKKEHYNYNYYDYYKKRYYYYYNY